MEHYSYREYADMHLIYGQALGNCVEARKNYPETFPNRRLPHRRSIERVDRSLKKTCKKSSEFKEILKLANFLLIHFGKCFAASWWIRASKKSKEHSIRGGNSGRDC